MTLAKVLKSVEACHSKLLLKLGPYSFTYEKGDFFDDKGRLVKLTAEQFTSTDWLVVNY